MPTHAKFTTVWTITWPEFENLKRKKIVKIISPSYKNVVFRFQVEFGASDEGNEVGKFGMGFFYLDGPLDSLDDCMIWWYNLRHDWKRRTYCDTSDYYNRSDYNNRMSFRAKRGYGSHWTNFEDKDIDVLMNKYDLDASDDLHYSITVSIPLTAFDYKVPKPEIEQRPRWFKEIFECLDDADESDLSDVRFVASDGGTFHCHQIIVRKQSKQLETMLKNPISHAEKSGVFCFPSLDTRSLHSILEYLYTGEYRLLMELPVTMIIQVADFGEQYGLKVLKEACIGQLWYIVGKNPKHAVEILRFSDLHPDAKYLKDRAMSVIVENFERLSLQERDFSGGNHNDLQGNRLKEEYLLYTMRRLGILSMS